jgi:citrate lyase beta subunit
VYNTHIIHDPDLLKRETQMDIARGYVGKTAIHPCQVAIIHAALQVTPSDLEMARAILDDSAAAVFQIGGAMCEPATHSAWARKIVARGARWGVDNGPQHGGVPDLSKALAG